jgi:uncharacterized protein (TIGR03067 family)
MSRLAAALVALPIALLLGADDPDQGDKAKIVGTWEITAAEQQGQKLPKSLLSGRTITFEKEKYIIRVGGEVEEEGTFGMDSEKSPKSIDLKIVKGMDEGKDQLGIYELDGDSLKIAFAKPGDEKRPAEFTTSGEGAALFTMTLKRKAP